MFGSRNALILMTLLACSTLAGCAVTRPENRVLLNSLDKAVQGSAITRSTTARVLAAPIALPVGVTAGVLDAAVVTPARAAVPAAKDTSVYLWENPQGSDLRQMMLLVPKIVATPVLFVTDWTCRSVFSTKFE